MTASAAEDRIKEHYLQIYLECVVYIKEGQLLSQFMTVQCTHRHTRTHTDTHTHAHTHEYTRIHTQVNTHTAHFERRYQSSIIHDNKMKII